MRPTKEQRIILAERNHRIIQDYLAGMTKVNLRIKYNISVDRILSDSGIKFNKKRGRRLGYIPKETFQNTEDKRKFKEERNAGIIKDWQNRMTRKEIAKKYLVSSALVYKIIRYIEPLEGHTEPPILTEGEQRIKDKLKCYNDPDAKDKFHKRDPNVTNYIGDMQPLITVRPRHYY